MQPCLHFYFPAMHKGEITTSCHGQGEKISSLPASQGSRRKRWRRRGKKNNNHHQQLNSFPNLKLIFYSFKVPFRVRDKRCITLWNGYSSQHDTFPFKDIKHQILNLKQIYVLKSCPQNKIKFGPWASITLQVEAGPDVTYQGRKTTYLRF